jgi:hypothetical protein
VLFPLHDECAAVEAGGGVDALLGRGVDETRSSHLQGYKIGMCAKVLKGLTCLGCAPWPLEV